jgi:hypothetical protein
MIASALSAFVLAAVLSTFVFAGRTGLRASAASELESEVRRGLETFAQDARRAVDLRWHSAQSVTFTLPGGARVTYAYDAERGSPTHRAFVRFDGDPGSAAPRRALVRGVAPDLAFRRYKVAQEGVADNAAANDRETKQIQVVLRAERTPGSTAGASQSVASARHVLRNKRVAN